jgi:DNA polymerase III epsilon subunit-like protein
VDARPWLRDDPELATTTFVVVDFETTTPTGARPEPIDVAAIMLRFDGADWAQDSRFTELMCPPAHAPVTPFDIAQTGITAAMVANADPAVAVLAKLDTLVNPDAPNLLVAHNAAIEGGILHDYRTACPTLAHTNLLDSVKLARKVWPELPSHRLDALLCHLQIPQPANRHRAMPDVEVTATVFGAILAAGDRTHRWSTLGDVRRDGLLVAKANQPRQGDLFADDPW